MPEKNLKSVLVSSFRTESGTRGGSVGEWDSDRVSRSAHDEFRKPSVIRRRTYINVRRRREQSTMKRLRIYMRDKFRCQHCGELWAGDVMTA